MERRQARDSREDSMTLVTRIDLTGLERLTAELEPKAEAILTDAAFEIEAQAKVFEVRFKTGALRNGINVNQPFEKMRRVISDSVTYGIYHELGTSRISAQPFMVPAVEAVRAKFEKMWEALFK
jgi:HK97 gp10 family phage protein